MNKKYKKYAISIGTISITTIPIVSAISCQEIKWEAASMSIEDVIEKISDLQLIGDKHVFEQIDDYRLRTNINDADRRIMKSLGITERMLPRPNSAFIYEISAPARDGSEDELTLTIKIISKETNEFIEISKGISLVDFEKPDRDLANAEQERVNLMTGMSGYKSDLVEQDRKFLSLSQEEIVEFGLTSFRPTEGFEYMIHIYPRSISDMTATISILVSKNGIASNITPTPLSLQLYDKPNVQTNGNTQVVNVVSPVSQQISQPITSPNGLDVLPIQSKTLGEDTSIDFKVGSVALDNVLNSLTPSVVIGDQILSDALDEIEIWLRDYATLISANPDAPMTPTIEYWANLFDQGIVDAITVGTYESTHSTDATPPSDDYISIGINGLTRDLSIQFLKDANSAGTTSLSPEAKLVWDAMMVEINLLPTTP